MEPSEVVQALWQRFQDRNWTGAAELVAPDAVYDWPASRERIVGRDNIIGVNREYPEGWSINVLRVLADGEQVAAEIEVPHVDLGLFRAASFYTVRGGQIAGATEYWTTVGADEPPADRSKYVERY